MDEGKAVRASRVDRVNRMRKVSSVDKVGQMHNVNLADRVSQIHSSPEEASDRKQEIGVAPVSQTDNKVRGLVLNKDRADLGSLAVVRHSGPVLKWAGSAEPVWGRQTDSKAVNGNKADVADEMLGLLQRSRPPM